MIEPPGLRNSERRRAADRKATLAQDAAGCIFINLSRDNVVDAAALSVPTRDNGMPRGNECRARTRAGAEAKARKA